MTIYAVEVMMQKAFSDSARASALEARRRKAAAKLQNIEKAVVDEWASYKPIKQYRAEIERKSNELKDATQSKYDALGGYQKSAISHYTGVDYLWMNKFANKVAHNPKPAQVNKMNRMDKALDLMELPESTFLYRSVDINRLMKQPSVSMSEGELRKLVGSTFTDPSFGSSSISTEKAYFFRSHTRVMLEIRAPKGTKGAYLGNDSKRGLHEKEHEFLLPRDRVYQVRSVEKREFTKDGGKVQDLFVVQVDMLNPTGQPKNFGDFK